MIQLVPAVDLLFEAVAEKGHVCVGLDTSPDYVPPLERRKAENDAEAVLAFNKALIDATCEIAACFKVQIAYYEEMGVSGLRAYSETLKYIRQKRCISIADIKRGDIADTALRYAKAHFLGDFKADFVTLNPYMGMDAIEPWLKEARMLGTGAFVLMRTSNPGMKDFEYLETKDGKRLYNAVGGKMSALAEKNRGHHGYGLFGIVVGCTERDEAAQIRQDYPELFFLIPGYGAQGGGAQDAALLLREGNGGVVNASRSIITAWQKEAEAENADNNFAAEAAKRAAVKMRDEIRGIIK
jgi:orotidine-5'-phosphate decarboxylase